MSIAAASKKNFKVSAFKLSVAVLWELAGI
jgi:hypothetical protein